MAGGIVFAEFRIAAKDRERMAGWHSQDHIRERLEAGVSSASRYVSFEDELHFCCVYRALSADLFSSPGYGALGAKASALTNEIAAGVSGTRCVGDVVAEVGDGQGGIFARLRLGDWSEAAAETFAAQTNVDGQIGRVTILRPRRDAPNISDNNWIVMVEGAGTPKRFEREVAAIALELGTAEGKIEVFRLEHAMWATVGM